MRAVDTNLLVRLVARDDPNQFERAKAFVSGGAWVSHLVLGEAAGVLSNVYRMAPQELAHSFERLLSQQDVVLEDPATVSAALAAFRAHPRLGFNDCLILAIAQKAGHLPLGTFNRELGKLDGAERV